MTMSQASPQPPDELVGDEVVVDGAGSFFPGIPASPGGPGGPGGPFGQSM